MIIMDSDHKKIEEYNTPDNYTTIRVQHVRVRRTILSFKDNYINKSSLICDSEKISQEAYNEIIKVMRKYGMVIPIRD